MDERRRYRSLPAARPTDHGHAGSKTTIHESPFEKIRRPTPRSREVTASIAPDPPSIYPSKGADTLRPAPYKLARSRPGEGRKAAHQAGTGATPTPVDARGSRHIGGRPDSLTATATAWTDVRLWTSPLSRTVRLVKAVERIFARVLEHPGQREGAGTWVGTGRLPAGSSTLTTGARAPVVVNRAYRTPPQVALNRTSVRLGGQGARSGVVADTALEVELALEVRVVGVLELTAAALEEADERLDEVARRAGRRRRGAAPRSPRARRPGRGRSRARS